MLVMEWKYYFSQIEILQKKKSSRGVRKYRKQILITLQLTL